MNRSQSVIGSLAPRDPRYPPNAFTREGIAMLSGVLKSARAVQVNIEIMRAFVRLQPLLAAHEEVARRLDELERKTDTRFAAVFKAIRLLFDKHAEPPAKKTRSIGFRSGD